MASSFIGELINAMNRLLRRSTRGATRFPFIAGDRVNYVWDGVFRFMLHFIMEIQGSLHPEHLAKAIDLALERSPILKSIARLKHFASYWEVVQDLAPYLILTVKDLSREVDGERPVKDVLESFINESIDITQSPPARFLLLSLAGGRSVFVVKVHHCALDPMGLFHLIEDIQEAYGALLEGKPLPPVGEMADRSRKRLFWTVSPLLWWRVVSKAFLMRTQAPRSTNKCFVRFSNPRPTETIAYQSLSFREGEYAALRARCKALGVTASELVLAALCRTIRAWNGPPEPADGVYSIVMPVDLRRYARQGGKVPRIMASFLGGSLVTVPVTAVTTFEATLDRVTKQTRFIKDHHLGLLPNLGFPLLYFLPPRWLREMARRYYERNPGKSIPTAVFAYLGKIDRVLSSFPGCPITGVEGVGAGFYPVGLDVVVASYGHTHNVTVTYLKDVCSEAEMGQFMTLFSHEILPPSQPH
jgi:NRPS condensation-like uncharacterized protein